MTMDVQRDPAILRRRQRRRILVAAIGVTAVIAASVGVSRLEPAAPDVAASTLWFGTARRGPMVREVRGTGTLVPEDIRWIAANTSGRVERIRLRPGARVDVGTVLLDLENRDLRQAARSAELDWQTALAQLANQKAIQANARLLQQAAVDDAESTYRLNVTELEMNRELAGRGLVAGFSLKQKEAAVAQARNRLELARRQLAASVENERLQMAPAEAAVNQRRADYDRALRQVTDLEVKATMAGLLQAVNVEVGQDVGPGMNLARVSDPARLKAEIRVPETQTKDLAVGQRATIDTRNGHVTGRVSRIDPASNGGTVGVDVALEGSLPPGARPDLTVDGTIELERLDQVLFVESPAFGQEQGTVTLFKVTDGGNAVRTTVKLGRRSVQFVEVVDGLSEGDRVVLSDMSQYDAVDRVALR